MCGGPVWVTSNRFITKTVFTHFLKVKSAVFLCAGLCMHEEKLPISLLKEKYLSEEMVGGKYFYSSTVLKHNLRYFTCYFT